MSSQRPLARRIGIVALAAAMLVVTVAIPVVAATGHVSGTVTFMEQVTLSGNAVAVITVVDQAAANDAGAVIGEQRIDSVGGVPIPFSIPYDTARIDLKHAYGLYATIVDGSKSWQNPQGVAVITGGPTDGVGVTAAAVGTGAAALTGTITKADTAALGPEAVAIAALIKEETGTLVSRQVQPVTGQTPVAFTIGYDPSIIDPAASYVVKAGIVDGSTVYENKAGVDAISGGAAAPSLTVPVAVAPLPIPVTSPFPTALPTASEAPSGSATAKPSGSLAPTESPTEQPSATAKPSSTPAPTEKPSPTPAPTPSPEPTPSSEPTPSPSPTEAPTASPTPSPTTSPSPSPSPSPTATSANPTATPTTGAVTGTLTYVEPHTLSASAVAVVVLVRGTARASEGSIVATQVIQNPGATPIDFRVVYENADIDPSGVYTVQAGIVDGDNVWTTAKGTKVVTNGSPTSDIDLTLNYQPDLIKGEVSGSITGVGIQLSATAYSVAVLIEPSTGESIGMDVNPTDGQIPAAFAVPFSLDAIDPAKAYVVTGELVDGTTTWENTSGVPVITNGNAISDVQVVVTPVVAPSPSPGLPTTEEGRGDITPALLLMIVALIVGAIGLFLWSRSRRPTTVGGPEDQPAPDAAPEPAEPPEPDSPVAPEDATAAEAPPAETGSPPGEEPKPDASAG